MAKTIGLDSFKRKVTRLRKTVDPEVGAALLKAGDLIAAEQKRLAPVDDGTLRDSIKSKATQGAKSGNQAVQISTGVFYAPFVEFGTQKAPAQPFFFPGYRATRRKARSVINKAVRESVKKSVS